MFGKPLSECSREELLEGIQALGQQVDEAQQTRDLERKAHLRTMANGSVIIEFLQRQMGYAR